ncbi:putative invertase inhibitor [Cornus florida]|uniref:putative invertase inhibitor n=1 Tax=Cornus florida TaxID=4283 RepID=UPI00289E2C2E|nr:putative invertase inhibitor [Cornus florida]
MWHCSLFSFSFSFCFLFFFLLIMNQNSLTIKAFSVDLINTTCKQCADKSTILNCDFCVSSLQAVPISHATNLQGLVIIAMGLANQNATNTVSSIDTMMGSEAFDPFAMGCLKDCSELYTNAVTTLKYSLKAFLLEDYATANVLVSGVMEAAVTCEEGFTEKEGEVTPLTKENYNLFELSDIALCIINLLSLNLPPMSS